MKFEPMNAQKARENSADCGLSYESREVLREILEQIEYDSNSGYLFSSFPEKYKRLPKFNQDNIKRSLMTRDFNWDENQIYWD